MFWFETGVMLGSVMFITTLALPNVSGSVYASGIDNEATSTLGAMLRAQQSVFVDRGRFATTFEDLGVPLGGKKFYTFEMVESETGLIVAKGKNNQMNETKDYIAGVNYNPNTRIFSTTVCIANTKSNQYRITKPTEAISNYGVVEQGRVKCEKGVEKVP